MLVNAPEVARTLDCRSRLLAVDVWLMAPLAVAVPWGIALHTAQQAEPVGIDEDLRAREARLVRSRL